MVRIDVGKIIKNWRYLIIIIRKIIIIIWYAISKIE
jgi:hypothetical protein